MLTDMAGVTTSTTVPKKFRFWDFVDPDTSNWNSDTRGLPIKRNKETGEFRLVEKLVDNPYDLEYLRRAMDIARSIAGSRQMEKTATEGAISVQASGRLGETPSPVVGAGYSMQVSDRLGEAPIPSEAMLQEAGPYETK